MIKVPAEKLARAVEKHLLPGLLRNMAEQQRTQQQDTKKSS
jgi:hypothetical protein